MPNIAYWHPQIVHFVVALSILGVAARVLSLVFRRGRTAFLGPMATTLILVAALASIPAVQSGMDAHGPAERVPGARGAVEEHEESGERARNFLLVLALIEIAGLALAGRPAVAMAFRIVSAVAGVGAAYLVYQAGHAGGEVVYAYAGGVGTRSGNAEDPSHLLAAGLYHNAMRARDAGRHEDAARWLDELARIRPGDRETVFLSIESTLEDHSDPRGALSQLDALTISEDDGRGLVRRALLAARAYASLGQPDSGRALLEVVKREHPGDPRIQAAVARALARLDAPR